MKKWNKNLGLRSPKYNLVTNQPHDQISASLSFMLLPCHQSRDLPLGPTSAFAFTKIKQKSLMEQKK